MPIPRRSFCLGLVVAVLAGCASGSKDVQVALFADAKSGATVRKVGTSVVKDDAQLTEIFADARDVSPDATVTIDADARVPYADVQKVMDLARRAQIAKVEIAVPAPPAAPATPAAPESSGTPEKSDPPAQR